VENFSVKDMGDEDNTIERTKPLQQFRRLFLNQRNTALLLQVWVLKFAKEGNFTLARLGYVYGWELPNIGNALQVLHMIIKWNAYDMVDRFRGLRFFWQEINVSDNPVNYMN
jgi:hypothetical protein